MSYFVLAYDRGRGEILKLSEFGAGERSLALDCRARLAGSYPSAEVVLLSSSSKDALFRTHARYFESLGDLLRAQRL